jgi:hypothetical protein
MCLDICLDIINTFVEFQIRHIPRHEDLKANLLAQQASGYNIGGRNFHVREKLMHKNFSFFPCRCRSVAKADCPSRLS